MSESASQTFLSNSPSDTARLAAAIARQCEGGNILSLEGDLGAGKTAFTRALALALGIEQPVTSPTFVIQKQYAVRDHPSINSLVHYDFYRIMDYFELVDMGFEAHDKGTLVITEWGDRFIKEFPARPIRISFTAQSNDSRLIIVSGLSLPPIPGL